MKLLVLLSAFLFVASGANAIEIVAHRGANEKAPENTKAAAQICIDLGVEYIEVDVRTSKDGVLYILHDPTVDRTTNGTGRIVDLTSDQIDALDAGSWVDPKFSSERIPRLEDFLIWVKGKAKVYFDVKACDVDKLIKLIHDTGFEKDCFLWSGEDSLMNALREKAPKLPLKVNVITPEDVKAAKREYNARIVEFRPHSATPEMIKACRRLRIKAMDYVEENDPEAFRKAIEIGADMINLNHPDVFVQIRDEMAAAKKK